MSRQYGPHDPLTAPEHVKVLRRHRDGGEALVPVPVVLTRQRAQINRRAWEAGR